MILWQEFSHSSGVSWTTGVPSGVESQMTRECSALSTPAPKKVRPFDGSAELEAYLIQFEIVATANGWDEDAKATALASALSGPALALLSDVSPPRTYRRLVAALEERYGVQNQAQMFLTLLNTRIQKPEEDIQQFHQAIRTLARNSVSDVERHGVYHFARGLRDAEVRRAISTLSPATMSEALGIALRVEAASQRDRTYQGLRLRGAEAVDVEMRQDSVQQRPSRNWSLRPNSQVACWRCDGLGHYCRDCPTWGISKKQFAPQGNDRRPN
uniref:CCHC-type domain-containing protein n=1 Tax=Lygus hesperus TaxID=30085 RepID=A0A0K8TH95_LYGHE